MQRVLTLAMAGVFALMVSTQAQAQTYSFTAALHGGNEIPAVNTGSAGTATVTLNATTRVLTYRIDVYNMPVGTTAGHFHAGAAGTAGPTVINFTIPTGISNDYAVTGTATAADLTLRQAQGIGSWDDFQQALLLGNIYVNIHSTNNPGGEIRGQITRVP